MARTTNSHILVKAKHSYRIAKDDDNTNQVLVSTNDTIFKRDDMVGESLHLMGKIGPTKKSALIEVPFRDYFFFLTKQHLKSVFKSATGDALPVPNDQTELEAFYADYKYKLVVRKCLITSLSTHLASEYNMDKCSCTIEFINEDANDDPLIRNKDTPEDLKALPEFFHLTCSNGNNVPTQQDILSTITLVKRQGRPRNEVAAQEEGDATPVTTPKATRPGRPRKGDAATQVKKEGDATTASKRRGRPPKSRAAKKNKKAANKGASDSEKSTTPQKTTPPAKQAASTSNKQAKQADDDSLSSTNSEKTKSSATDNTGKKRKNTKNSHDDPAVNTPANKRPKVTSDDESTSTSPNDNTGKAEDATAGTAPEAANNNNDVTMDWKT